MPGQVVANALYYYTKPNDYIVDPFAGSGTLGDVVDNVPHFQDRKYKMYDANPIDERIGRNNILLTASPSNPGPWTTFSSIRRRSLPRRMRRQISR